MLGVRKRDQNKSDENVYGDAVIYRVFLEVRRSLKANAHIPDTSISQ